MATRPRSEVSRYLDLPYEVAVVRRDGQDGMAWTAQVEELGCEVRARTDVEALTGVRAAMADRIADALAHDRPVPQPREAATHSGRLLVRMPQSLHADLARLADRERVSLNALIVGILGGAVAWRQPAGPAPAAPARPASEAAEAAPAPAPAVEDPQPARLGLLMTALRVNVVVVAVAGVVAVALLVAALVA
jgi:predicted HicB family RNase H-like nuclease